MPATLNQGDIDACRALQKKHGTSYFFATTFLPKDIHWAVNALYAFFRIPDEIVDSAGGDDPMMVNAKLEGWIRSWRAVRAGEQTSDPVLRLTNQAFERFHIPDQYAEEFFASMMMDVNVSEYATYEDVRKYMYGSAAVVGRMMMYVLGHTSELAFEKGDALAYAMQWTNFLRDIDEDWIERKRVYLPQDRLRAHGLTSTDIAERRFGPAFEALMREEIARADTLYTEAEQGIRFLATGGLGVLVAGRLYQAILRRIEAQGRNPFLGRARTSFVRKLVISGGAVRDYRALLAHEEMAKPLSVG